jgi:hypothetical protein
MIDFGSYNTYGPGIESVGSLLPITTRDSCSCSYCITADQRMWLTNFVKKKEAQICTDDLENYRLLPPRVLSYTLNEREWAQLSVDRVPDCRPHSLGFLLTVAMCLSTVLEAATLYKSPSSQLY